MKQIATNSLKLFTIALAIPVGLTLLLLSIHLLMIVYFTLSNLGYL